MRGDLRAFLSSPGFGDTWLYSDREPTMKLRARDYRASVVSSNDCPECGARAGSHCVRETLRGSVARRLPHFGRSPPLHSVNALRRVELL